MKKTTRKSRGTKSTKRSAKRAWLLKQRKTVEKYLRAEHVDHLGVGTYPAFCVHPYLALWAVQSKQRPGWVGWWAISGDLPTDYISSSRRRTPRAALRGIARQWREAARYMLQGRPHPDYQIGTPEDWPELGDLLRRRARIIQSWVDDATLWSEK
jgi:hypothetical protein